MKVFRVLFPLRSRRFQLFFGFTLSSLNVGLFLKTVQAVQAVFPQVTAREFHMNLVHTSAHYYQEQKVGHIPPKEIERFKEEVTAFIVARKSWRNWMDPIAILENRYLLYAIRYMTTGRSQLPCQALARTLFLGPTGMVFPCTIWNTPLGNIRDHAYCLYPILVDARSVRSAIQAAKCPQCWTPCESYAAILASLHKRP